MGMLLGGQGLLTWRDGWTPLECPLSRVDLLASSGGDVSALDNGLHRLWHAGQTLPCDRDAEALRLWQGHALVLSSDTDCLALADPDGWLVTARVGMYPQDVAVTRNAAYVCGGADGLVHLLELPGLRVLQTFPVPGMPQRIAIAGDAAHVLCFTAEDDVFTEWVHLDLQTGRVSGVARYPGLPGAVLADPAGLWLGVTEHLYHYPASSDTPDADIAGFGLIRHMDAHRDSLLVTDPVAGIAAQVTGRTAVHVLYRGDVGQAVFLT